MHLYKFLEDNPSGPLRNKNKYDEDCKNQLLGMKGKIGLSELRFFSPLYNTNIDYMHSLLEGVIKRFFKYWFDQNCEQSIKIYTTEIDKRLLSIKPPSLIPICPRSIDTREEQNGEQRNISALCYIIASQFYLVF